MDSLSNGQETQFVAPTGSPFIVGIWIPLAPKHSKPLDYCSSFVKNIPLEVAAYVQKYLDTLFLLNLLNYELF